MFSCRNSQKSKERERRRKNKEAIFDLRTITFFAQCFVKFVYSQKATKFCRILALLLSYVVPVKSKVKISQNCGLLRIYELYNPKNSHLGRHRSAISKNSFMNSKLPNRPKIIPIIKFYIIKNRSSRDLIIQWLYQ